MTDFPDFIRDLPAVDISLPGVSGHLLQAPRHQVAFLRFDQDVEVPEHSHRAQWEIVLAGEAELDIGGEVRTLRAGDAFFVPAGVPHSARLRAGYRSLVVFDEASRYRARPVSGP